MSTVKCCIQTLVWDLYGGQKMKKYIGMAMVLTIICGAASAMTCKEYGVTIGANCGSGSNNSTITGSMVISNCQEGSSSCVYKECGGTCQCVANGVCPTSQATGCPNTCSGDVTWKTESSDGATTLIPSGKDTGTAVLQNKKTCACTNVTVYRCQEGYYASESSWDSTYAITLYRLGSPYTTTLKCTACPKADGDTNLYFGAPSYVTSNVGVYQLGYGTCKIKANAEIPTETGKYVYTDAPCEYTELEIWKPEL